MVNPVSASAVVVVLVLLLLALLVAWRRRVRAQVELVLPPVPDELGDAVLSVRGLHVATTFAGRPLDRVVAGGLGFRAAAVLTVTDRGVLVEPAGARPFLLPTGEVTGGTATWALDRVVERDGLVVLAWALTDQEGNPVPVESAFRLDPADQAALLAALPTDQEVSDAGSSDR